MKRDFSLTVYERSDWDFTSAGARLEGKRSTEYLDVVPGQIRDSIQDVMESAISDVGVMRLIGARVVAEETRTRAILRYGSDGRCRFHMAVHIPSSEGPSVGWELTLYLIYGADEPGFEVTTERFKLILSEGGGVWRKPDLDWSEIPRGNPKE